LQELYGSSLPPLVLCGHSMGGAIAIRTAPKLPRDVLKAIVVVDVVEGTAVAALPKMTALLAARPKSFATKEDAIVWAVSSGMIRNKESACVSIPPQVKEEGGRFVWKICSLRPSLSVVMYSDAKHGYSESHFDATEGCEEHSEDHKVDEDGVRCQVRKGRERAKVS